MRISYDEESRGLMIAFGDAAHYVESREVAPGVVVDFDKDGKPLAVELEDVAAVMDPRELTGHCRPSSDQQRCGPGGAFVRDWD